MKNNTLSIKIEVPVKKLSEYCENPKNTSKWIDFIEKEEINTSKPEVGTIYKNYSVNGKEGIYELVKYEKNKIFKLKSKNSNYEVTYFFIEVEENSSILVYFEEMSDGGELEEPFSIEVLKKLKFNLENNN